mgnify:CR=1 FL=1
MPELRAKWFTSEEESTVATKKKKQTGMTLELDGKVFLVDRQPGKRAVKTEIDGAVVLQIVLAALSEGLRLREARNG